MKKIFLKRLIISSLIFTVVSGIVPKEVNASWSNTNNNWTWTENGVKVKGWKYINGKWYHFNSQGVMNIGWIYDVGKWYYLTSSGEMKIGWLKDKDEKWYYLSTNGEMKTGWLKDKDEKWYHLSNSGSMDIGWLNDNGKKYYLNQNGSMVSGNVIIEGQAHTFGSDGALIISNNSSDFEDSNNAEFKVGYVSTVNGELNVRSEASISSKIIGSLKRGTKINIYGDKINDFYKIQYLGLEGFVSSNWVSFEKPDVSDDLRVELGEIRTTVPDIKNQYYYSDNNIFYKAKYSPPFYKNNGDKIIGNCTWYAWGRIWELTGIKPYDANFTGNAYEWWQANIKTGKYNYGLTPKLGAIAVWKSSLPNTNGNGHVAVVEKIENNKIYISESSWSGVLFKFREIYNTEYLYGYIYIDEPNF